MIESEDQAKIKAAIKGFQHIINFCKSNNLSVWGSLSVTDLTDGDNLQKGHVEMHTVHWIKKK